MMTALRLAATSFIAGSLLLLAAPTASAQCFGPDNLDIGVCCQPTFPTLPPFGPASLGGLGICWNQCSPTATNTLKVSWTPPTQPQCTQYITQLTVADAGGFPMLSGTLVLDYTRTWNEIDTTGALTQVWRFTAKADLTRVPGSPNNPCLLPTCLAPVGPYATAFYYGYVDYAGCTAGGVDNVLVLYHNCDRFIHQPGLSDKPGVFHPGRSYGIVAPHSTLQPFVPANLIAPGGPLVGEATRNVGLITPPPFACMVEDHVVGGAMNLLGAGCVCTMTSNPKQQSLRQLNGTNNCVSTAGTPTGFASLSVNFPVLPWMHLVSTSIGTWTNPVVYPGLEAAWADEGLFIRQDACTGDFVELKYGASTSGGWTPLLPIPVIVTNFTDLADNYTAPLFGPYPTPILGSIRPTDHLIYVNTP
ncbi:MAG: hypothetical protein ACT4PU_04385 [Planctomycetota bacterium]